MIGDHRLEQSRLFMVDADHGRFVDRLGERVKLYNIRLYLFACMTNHIHLVFETPEANCSKFMQSLSTAYTVYYNLRHSRHGHLFDGRYKAKLVEGDNYLLALTRYVHLNPVQVGSIRHRPLPERIQRLRQYRWSTYQSYIGVRKAFDFVEYGPIRGQMGGKRVVWPERYRDYVEAGLREDERPLSSEAATNDGFKVALTESPRSIGSDGFRIWVDEFYQQMIEAHNVEEDISFRHRTEPLPVDTILAVLSEALGVDVEAFRQRRRNSPLRGIAARMLLRFGGQTQRQVAEYLEMGTGGAVSAAVKKLPMRLAEDRSLRRKLKAVEKRLHDSKKSR